MHVQLGDYHVRDVEFVAAFDVDGKKVGQDLAHAILASENNTIKIAEVPPTGVTVQRGPTLDGLGEYYREIITESDEPAADVAQVLRETGADVLVSYLPVGSEQADRYYAQCAIDAHVAFVNALPVFIASDPQWAARFTEAGVPIIGDDIKSQVGATITHRVMAKLFEDRGVELLRPAYRNRKSRPGQQLLAPIRQLIESVNDTLKGQLDLELHGGRSLAGVTARVAQRLLVLTAAIWHNRATGQPLSRSLTAYDH
jgi:myo-inositol-1-phosphate synthase